MADVITIKKIPLVYRSGDYPPTSKGLKARRYLADETPSPSDHKIGEVSIAALEVDGKKLAQYRVMSGCMAIPDQLCWFYVEYVYPWRLQTGAQDSDRILTDGETFFLVNRDLAQSPFVLNDFTKGLINAAILGYTEKL